MFVVRDPAVGKLWPIKPRSGWTTDPNLAKQFKDVDEAEFMLKLSFGKGAKRFKIEPVEEKS